MNKITRTISVSKGVSGVSICRENNIIEFRRNGRKVVELKQSDLVAMLKQIGVK